MTFLWHSVALPKCSPDSLRCFVSMFLHHFSLFLSFLLYLFQEESTLYLHINNICKIILCIVLKVKIKQSPCFYRKNKGNCYSLILFSVLRSFAKIRIFFIHPYTFVMQNLWIFCICTLICITLCFICSDSYVM